MRFAKTLITATALMLIVAAASYGAVAFTTSSTLNFLAPNARTGLAGNIQLSALTAGSLGGTAANADTLTISYGAPQISVLSPVAVTFNLVGGTVPFCVGPATCAGYVAGPFTAYGAPLSIGAGITVTVNPNSIAISFLAAAPTPFVAGDNIQIAGVRLNLVPATAGSTVGGQVNATLGTVASLITVTNPSLPVVTVAKGIALSASTVTGTKPPISISTGSIVISNPVAGSTTKAMAGVDVKELGSSTNAFETNGAGSETQAILTITNVPSGLTYDSAVIAARTTASVTAAVDTTKSGQTGSTATIVVNISAQDPTVLEVIGVDITFKTAGGSIPPGTSDLTATLGPEATSTQLAAIVAAGAGIPFGPGVGPLRYFNNPEPPVSPFITVVNLQSELLAVYNASIPASYETGFSIANTSGILGIAGQTDTIKVTFYAADGTAATSITTSATIKPGVGLNPSGQLVPGASWIVTLGELLSAAGISPGWQGQVRFTCNFTNAHGLNFIYNSNTAQGFPMLSLPPTNVARSAQYESVGN